MGCFKLTYREELPTLKVVKGFSFSKEKSCAGLYRYGFNGMEKDDEVNGVTGSSYTTEFRQYDSRLARWLSLDPLMAKYPHQSPYVAFNNNPIFFADPTGLEGDPPIQANDAGAPAVDISNLKNVTHITPKQAEDAFKKSSTDPTRGFIKSGTGYEKVAYDANGQQGETQGSYFKVKQQAVFESGNGTLTATGVPTMISMDASGNVTTATINQVRNEIDNLIISATTTTAAPNGNEKRFPSSISIHIPAGASVIEVSNANKLVRVMQENYNLTINLVQDGGVTMFLFPGADEIQTTIEYKLFDYGF